ncbi:MAG: hypothetical protein GY861_29280 [bacterium]|nr:hypothetical protein [bacterium]
MINYKKYQIRRIKELSENYFEVVFQKGTLNFTPGDCVQLYKNEKYPIPIASGIGEVWCRLIMRRDIHGHLFPEGTKSIKICHELVNVAPTLMAEEKPNFVLTPEMVGIFFSYVSTFPEVKCKVCYLGDERIQEDWISMAHKVVSPKQIKKCDCLYVLGRQSVIERKLKNIVNNCKGSYLI